MPRFVFTYRVPNIPLEQRLAELGPSAGREAAALWDAWMDSLGEHVTDRGHRVSDARFLGRCEPGVRSSGYSVIAADCLETAMALAADCPFLSRGGGIEVGVIPEPAGS
jgi:hypothetical protein